MDKTMNTTKDFYAILWLLTRPYWFSEERRSARLLLAAVLALNLGIVFINVEINICRTRFTTHLRPRIKLNSCPAVLSFAGLPRIIVMAV